ncbi:MAG: hypothetical protein JNK79_12710 [Chitinophagaceae bacterium]|nr:hypothetical protein [Chitinophagaceae bacterium]
MIQRTLMLTLVFFSIAAGAPAQTQKLSYVTGALKDAVIPNQKVAVSFQRSYPDVQNEKWTVDKGYYFVTFTDGDIKNQVVYRQNGQLDYSMKTYGEKKLPKSIRSIVKGVYYDYKIIHAQELELNKSTIYLVKLSDASMSKAVRIADGQMEEIESYSTVISPCR